MKANIHQITVSTKQHRVRAFTLVEMLLVVTIIGILAALVIPRVVGVGEGARIKAARADINGGIKMALGRYEIETGHFPRGLQDLLTQQPTDTRWTGPYLDRMPLDPWGHDYIYYCPGKHNPGDYDLLSAGPDGKEGTEDDIASWQPAS